MIYVSDRWNGDNNAVAALVADIAERYFDSTALHDADTEVIIEFRRPSYHEDVLGITTCDAEDRVVEIEIYTDPSDISVTVPVIVHELVHAEQHLSKRLVYDYINNMVTFDDTTMEIGSVPYEDLPWEKEAFLYEELVTGELK